MNPYFHFLYLIPGVITGLGAISTNKKIRVISVFVSTVIFWYLLQKSVDWAYTHPEIEPSDGGPRAFSALFGWLIGLCTVILPVYITVRFALKKLLKTNKALK